MQVRVHVLWKRLLLGIPWPQKLAAHRLLADFTKSVVLAIPSSLVSQKIDFLQGGDGNGRAQSTLCGTMTGVVATSLALKLS